MYAGCQNTSKGHGLRIPGLVFLNIHLIEPLLIHHPFFSQILLFSTYFLHLSFSNMIIFLGYMATSKWISKHLWIIVELCTLMNMQGKFRLLSYGCLWSEWYLKIWVLTVFTFASKVQYVPSELWQGGRPFTCIRLAYQLKQLFIGIWRWRFN
jgi:hypothetical protein